MSKVRLPSDNLDIKYFLGTLFLFLLERKREFTLPYFLSRLTVLFFVELY